MKITNLTLLQKDLTQAFKWMAKATKEAQEGEFTGATQSMMFALEYWTKCQHQKDCYINEEVSEKTNWKFFTTKALAQAKAELIKEENE